MLKKGLCIFLSLILVIYLILFILVSTNYQKRDVGYSYELVHIEHPDSMIFTSDFIPSENGDYPDTLLMRFSGITIINDVEYYYTFNISTEKLKENVELGGDFYIDKIYLSHLADATDNTSYTQPYIIINNCSCRAFYYSSGNIRYYNIVCSSYEIILNTQTIFSIFGNNIAIVSINFDYGDISNVSDLLGWFNNFIRSIFNFTRNIISDFKGVF